MALSDYLSGSYGIGQHSFYLFAWVLTWNPAIFKAFKWYHYPFLLIGTALSYFNHRAIIPFLIISFLELDYSKMDMDFFKTMAFFFFICVLIYGAFGVQGAVV